MGKKSKKKRGQKRPHNTEHEISSSSGQTRNADKQKADQSSSQNHDANPKRQREDLNSSGISFRQKLDAFLDSLSPSERACFFSERHVTPERRAEVWMEQADVGEKLVDQYSWACPNASALKILKHFSPIVEIGCGANAYWCRMMKDYGIDVVGYDIAVDDGGLINKKKKSGQSKEENNAGVLPGGPEVLSDHEDRTLFLCYPDENDSDELNQENDEVEGATDNEPISLGQACLENYSGQYVIHVGEVFGDTLSMSQAPWGRSSSPMFQQQLAAEFHCILKIPLPSWLHVHDSLTVWKRSEMCTIVFAADDSDEEDEEVQYKCIPKEEQLPQSFAAPYLAHLLSETDVQTAPPPITNPT